MDDSECRSTRHAEYLFKSLPDDVLARILTYVPSHIGLSINRRYRMLTLRHVCSVAPRIEYQHVSASKSSEEGQATDPLDPHISDNSLVGILDALWQCPRLHTVKLSYLTTQYNIAALTQLPQIRELELGTVSASHLPCLACLTQLTALSIANCRGIATLDFVSGLRNLQDLTLSHAHSLEVCSSSRPSAGIWEQIATLSCEAVQISFSCLTSFTIAISSGPAWYMTLI
jgi:Leucine-rich repeat (LRR) protein